MLTDTSTNAFNTSTSNNILINKSWSNDNAWTLYRIGEAFYNTGDIPDACSFYKKAVELSPYNPELKNKYGASLMAQNKVSEAIHLFETILKEDSKFVPAINNLGYANLVSGNTVKAEDLYNNALNLDPDYEPLLMNVVGLKIYKKKYKEAEKLLKEILIKNPKNEQAKQILNQLKGMKA